MNHKIIKAIQKKIMAWSHQKCLQKGTTFVMEKIQQGDCQRVIEYLKMFPESVHDKDKEGRNVFERAMTLNRQKTLHFLYENFPEQWKVALRKSQPGGFHFGWIHRGMVEFIPLWESAWNEASVQEKKSMLRSICRAHVGSEQWESWMESKLKQGVMEGFDLHVASECLFSGRLDRWKQSGLQKKCEKESEINDEWMQWRLNLMDWILNPESKVYNSQKIAWEMVKWSWKEQSQAKPWWKEWWEKSKDSWNWSNEMFACEGYFLKKWWKDNETNELSQAHQQFLSFLSEQQQPSWRGGQWLKTFEKEKAAKEKVILERTMTQDDNVKSQNGNSSRASIRL